MTKTLVGTPDPDNTHLDNQTKRTLRRIELEVLTEMTMTKSELYAFLIDHQDEITTGTALSLARDFGITDFDLEDVE